MSTPGEEHPSESTSSSQPPAYLPDNPPKRPENSHTEVEPLGGEETTEKKRSARRVFLDYLFTILGVIIVASLIRTFVVQAFSVPSGSMESTLEPGDKFWVNKMSAKESALARGDVVVFIDPGNWLDYHVEPGNPITEAAKSLFRTVGFLPGDEGKFLVKRIIGMGGDTVECCTDDGKLKVNGMPINEPYLNPGVEPSLDHFNVTVPEGHLWMMGDNRGNSKDSRWHERVERNGFVPAENVVGKAWLIFSPLSRFGTLENYRSVFESVPEPLSNNNG